MARLRFYTDTHIAKQVAIQLRERGFEVFRCEDVGLATADDETHLRYATANGLILITKDHGFRLRHFQWMSRGQAHTGIFFCRNRQDASIGQIVITCEEYADLIEQGAADVSDIANEFIEVC